MKVGYDGRNLRRFFDMYDIRAVDSDSFGEAAGS